MFNLVVNLFSKLNHSLKNLFKIFDDQYTKIVLYGPISVHKNKWINKLVVAVLVIFSHL